jgi:hypothetical protein
MPAQVQRSVLARGRELVTDLQRCRQRLRLGMGQVSLQQWVGWQAANCHGRTWQAFQQGAKRLQALGIQPGERLACCPGGPARARWHCAPAVLQQAELVVQLFAVGLADEPEPAVQQGAGFVRASVGTELQVKVPQQLPGERIQPFGRETLQPATLAQRAQPGTWAAVLQVSDQQFQRLLGTAGEAGA